MTSTGEMRRKQTETEKAWGLGTWRKDQESAEPWKTNEKS